MQPLVSLKSRAAAIMNANVDTDVITPMQRLTRLSDKPLSFYAFEPLRYEGGNADSGVPIPSFPLNDPNYAGARILFCGENFGCGSSRESAPAAISELGFRCLVGSSFGDIFFNNCFQQGILPVVLERTMVERLAMLSRDGGQFELDLPATTLTTPTGEHITFDVNALRKTSLIEGLDDIGLTLRLDGRISAWQDADRTARPWIWRVGTGEANPADDPHTT